MPLPSFRTCETLRCESRYPCILMMPPDVELSELKAGGSFATNALRTRQGVSNLTLAVKGRRREGDRLLPIRKGVITLQRLL